MTEPGDSGDGGGSGFGNSGDTPGMGDGGNGDAPVVPEPGSLLMLAVGSVMGGVAYLRRRRRS
ncbi:MAG: PEP-CTERM sorting domain-containing protein [Fuerstiella sp.]